MAIYHLSMKIISRSAGRSATGASAYRSAERIRDERTGLVFDYRRKTNVAWKKIFAPVFAPSWAHDRVALFNAVEIAEVRKDAQVAREIVVALPHELSRDRQIDLLDRFVRRELVAQGMIADVCLHTPEGNHHAHILLTMRNIGADGFGKKNTDWNKKEFLEHLREAWALHCNRRLSVAGAKSRLDHRTLRAQGQMRRPSLHEGPTRKAMQRRGHSTRIQRINQLIKQENDMDKELQGLQLSTELPEGERWKSAGDNSVEPVTAENKWDAEIVQVPEYRARIRELFADEGAQMGRGSSFGYHLRIVLRSGGEVRHYGRRITCRNGTPDEARATVKLAVAKGWKALRVFGNESYRRSVWIEALRAGYERDEIKGYEPTAEDLALVRDLRLVPSTGLEMEIRVPIAISTSEGSQQKGAVLATPTSRKLRM